MTDFMVLVERAVRPVPTGPFRKQRMRDDLLAHLTGVYEDELPRVGEAAARAEAVRRFGDPAALAAELTASLSFDDRLDGRIDRWFGWKPGEPPHRTALRFARLVVAVVVPWMVLGAIACEVRRPADPTVPSAVDWLRIGAATLVFGGGCVFLMAWLTGRLRAALDAGNRLRAAGEMVGLALVMPVASAAVFVIAVPDWLTGAASAPRGTYRLEATVLSFVIMPVAALLLVRTTRAAVARRLEWARLDLGA